MPLESNEPKGRHWERNALPVVTTLTPGIYNNPQIIVDEYGRIVQALSGGGGAEIGVQNGGVPVAGGPFAVLNFTGGNITAVNAGSGIASISVSSSSTIGILDDGSVVAGGPFSSINFTGSGVMVADAGSGQVEVSIETGTATELVKYVKDLGGVATSQNIGSPIPADSIIRSVSVTVTTAYDAGATLEVQDGNNNVLMASTRINPQLIGTYVFETPGNTDAIDNPQILLIVDGTPPAVGNCVVDVIYELP